MSYQLYRNTTIGNTLQESLDELIQYGQITPALAVKVLLQFDKSINQALSNRVKSRLTFKAGKLNTYSCSRWRGQSSWCVRRKSAKAARMAAGTGSGALVCRDSSASTTPSFGPKLRITLVSAVASAARKAAASCAARAMAASSPSAARASSSCGTDGPRAASAHAAPTSE
ncbi:hypothetical protein MSG28_006968 [Choristoneura fumiferana]|uniref:Uncharacterized protein n=1 Tax=Choristoneura fumiferana TaxID=7141 RepID=A0ACC0JM05_CHOFU|nr:hypothetical protein MSG28_006968 [Choristoneura fumiferana]